MLKELISSRFCKAPEYCPLNIQGLSQFLFKSSNGPNEPRLDNAGVIHIDKKSIWIEDMRVCMNYIQAINDLHNVVWRKKSSRKLNKD